MKMPFMQMENVNSFIQAATQLGVPTHDMFQTVDLYEEKNMNQVVLGLLALGRTCQKVQGFSGPNIGPKLSDKHEVQFTQEQLRRGQNELNYTQKLEVDTQKTISDNKRNAQDSVVKTNSTGTTTAYPSLLEKDKSAIQKEASSAKKQSHNIIK